MNLEFGNLTVKNFQSFKELDLNFDTIKGTTTLILGDNRDDEFASSNGSGKSAVLEAISWVLFGLTFRPLRYADEIINLQENDCEVSLELFLNDKKYVINRFRTRNKPAILKLFEDEVELLKDSDSKSKQQQLESIIGFNFSTFTNSIMFHLDYVAFPELKPAERADILTEISNLEIYVNAAQQAKNDSLQINSKISEIKMQINSIETIISRLTENDFDIKIQSWENKKIFNIRALRNDIINLKLEMTNLKERIAIEILGIKDNLSLLLKNKSSQINYYEAIPKI